MLMETQCKNIALCELVIAHGIQILSLGLVTNIIIILLCSNREETQKYFIA